MWFPGQSLESSWVLVVRDSLPSEFAKKNSNMRCRQYAAMHEQGGRFQRPRRYTEIVRLPVPHMILDLRPGVSNLRKGISARRGQIDTVSATRLISVSLRGFERATAKSLTFVSKNIGVPADTFALTCQKSAPLTSFNRNGGRKSGFWLRISISLISIF